MKDTRYLNRVRGLPCCMCGAFPPVEAHHRTGGGMGLKANDRATMPLCTRCHKQFHDLNGRFSGWTKEQLREWQVAKIFKTMEELSR